jgi:hypothetical protein
MIIRGPQNLRTSNPCGERPDRSTYLVACWTSHSFLDFAFVMPSSVLGRAWRVWIALDCSHSSRRAAICIREYAPLSRSCSHIAHTIWFRGRRSTEKIGAVLPGTNYLRLVRTGSGRPKRFRFPLALPTIVPTTQRLPDHRSGHVCILAASLSCPYNSAPPSTRAR